MADALSAEQKSELRRQLVELDRKARAVEAELRSSLPPEKFQLVHELATIVQTIQAKLTRLLQ